MRRSLTLSAILIIGASLSGCAQINSVTDWISKPFKSELRETPKPDWERVETGPVTQSATYSGTTYSGPTYSGPTYSGTTSTGTVTYPTSYSSSTYPASTYAASSAPYASRTVATGQFYGVDEATDAIQTAAIAPPESLSYVRLNGESRMSDWENCERLHNGYWRIDAAGGRIDPGFEVCMRNKGYVRESELALYGFDAGARIAGQSNQTLTGGYRSATYASGSYSSGTYSAQSYGAIN